MPDITADEIAVALARRERSIADLEAALRGVRSLRLSFGSEWYLSGVRMNPGIYVVVRISDEPDKAEIPF